MEIRLSRAFKRIAEQQQIELWRPAIREVEAETGARIDVRFEDVLPSARFTDQPVLHQTLGMANSKNGRYQIMLKRNQSDEELQKSFCHECAHILCGHLGKLEFSKPYIEKEREADALAVKLLRRWHL